MKNKNFQQAQLELIELLLDSVNSKEEFNYLLAEKKNLGASLPTIEHGGPCGRFVNADGSCRTCNELAFHKKIYGNLNNKESLILFKERTHQAFQYRCKEVCVKMETENNVERKTVTSNQEILIAKLLRSRKITDKEFRTFTAVKENKIITSYDASILIAHLLTLINFRRTFFNGNHKAYKRCKACDTREKVERYLDLTSGKKAWLCETCAINLDPSKVVPVKQSEENEVACDLFRKERAAKLSSSQEDLICEHREQ